MTGRPHPKGSSDYANAAAYITHIKHQCRWSPASPFAAAALKDSSSSSASASALPANCLASDAQIFTALSELARGMKASPLWSVHDGIDALVGSGIFRADLHDTDAEDMAVAVQLVFAMSGAITMLYTPLTSPAPGSNTPPQDLRVDVSGTRGFFTSSQGIARAERPLVEVLKGFGDILPAPAARHQVRTSSLGSSGRRTPSESGSDLLEVPYLNLATLVNVGEIQIVWVKSISSHLEFDRFRRQLSLFCLPSFCLLNMANGTPCER